MGTVTPIGEARVARNRQAGHRRPCSCDACRTCPLCTNLLSSMGVKRAAENCTFQGCPMKGVIAIDDVFAEFAQYAPQLVAPAPKKKT